MVNKGKYVVPWSRQKKLQKRYSHSEVPTIKEIANLISKIDFGKTDPVRQTMQAQALFSLYYLTGCRLTELVRCTKLRKQSIAKIKRRNKETGAIIIEYELGIDYKPLINKKVVEHNYNGVRGKDIKTADYDGKQFIDIRLENRKNKTRIEKKLPIPIEHESEIIYFVDKYWLTLSEEEPLFNFGGKRATQIINQVTNGQFNAHYIRHIRATHLVTIYGFNEYALVRFMGWTDSRPAKRYVELNVKDLARQFIK